MLNKEFIDKPQSINERLLKSLIPRFYINGVVSGDENDDSVTEYTPHHNSDFVDLFYQGAKYSFKKIRLIVDMYGEATLYFFETEHSLTSEPSFSIKFISFPPDLDYR